MKMSHFLFHASVFSALFLINSNRLVAQAAIFDSVTSVTGVSNSFAAWGDYDNDGDLDLAVCGHTGSSRITRIYRNENGNFVDINASLPGIDYGSCAWGDYDGDGDLDLLISGNGLSRIYRNTSGSFSNSGIPLQGVFNASATWMDYDADGDLDILITGISSGTYYALIYKNTKGVFSTASLTLQAVYFGSSAWGDYDKDGDVDLLVTGHNGSTPVTRLYVSYLDTLSAISFISLEGLQYSSSVWGDYDNDGDLDILLTGNNGTSRVSKIYRNDGGLNEAAQFVDANAGLAVVDYGSSAWGDYDADGDLDILLTGFNETAGITKIYRNDSGVFSALTDISKLPSVLDHSSAAWGDYDNDGRLDLFLSGNTGSGRIATVYQKRCFWS